MTPQLVRALRIACLAAAVILFVLVAAAVIVVDAARWEAVAFALAWFALLVSS